MLNFFVCANGLGHLDRCVSLAQEIKKKTNYKIKIYCSKTGFDALNLKHKFHKSEIYVVKDMKYLKEESFDEKYWKKVLRHQANKNQVFISDNLINFLKLKPECIIIANFFWHDVDIQARNQERKLNALLKVTQPRVIGHHFFSMPIVKSGNFHPFGYGLKPRSKSTVGGKSLLISSGGSGRAIQIFREKKLEILSIAQGFNEIFLDKYLISTFSEDLENFRVADFSVNMFDNISYAISRPGMGTLKELYLKKIPYMPIFERAIMK